MVPSTAIYNKVLDLLAADTDTLAQAADALKVKLVVSNFTPSKTLDIDSVTLATFTGSTPKTVALDEQQVGYDPVSQRRFIQLIPPVGGWYWEASADIDPPQRVYGYIVTNNAGDELIGSDLLEESVLISAAEDSVEIPNIRLYLPADAFEQ